MRYHFGNCRYIYRTGKIDENDYFHKIQHLMIEASRGKKVLWRNHSDVLLWTLRGYIRYGKGFLDHLNCQGYKYSHEESESVVFRFKGRYLLVPSLRTCQRYSPAYAATNGISVSQMRILLQCFEKSEVISLSLSCCKLFFANLLYDGTLLKPSVEYCRHHHGCVGTVNRPLSYEDICRLNDLTEEEKIKAVRELPFATEALEFMAESLDSKIALPLGHFLIGNKGSSQELNKLIDIALKTLRKCNSYLEREDESRTDQTCNAFCKECFDNRDFCNNCEYLGLEKHQWNPLLRPCDYCLDEKKSCTKIVWLFLCSDCLEKQKKLMNDLDAEITSDKEISRGLVNSITGELRIFPSPDELHSDKNIIASYDNHLLLRNGEILSSKVIHILREHPDETISNPFREAISREELLRIDRMSNQVMMANVSTELQNALSMITTTVFTIANRERIQDNIIEEGKLMVKNLVLWGPLVFQVITEYFSQM